MRQPNTYQLTPILPPAIREAMWDGLRREYSPELFLQARELADTSDRPNHYDTIEALLRSIDRFGLLAVRGATTTIAALQRANPMRHVGYIITLLRNESIDPVNDRKGKRVIRTERRTEARKVGFRNHGSPPKGKALDRYFTNFLLHCLFEGCIMRA